MKEYYYLVTFCDNHYGPEQLESTVVTLAEPIDNPETYMKLLACLRESRCENCLTIVSISPMGCKDVAQAGSYMKLDYDVVVGSDVCSVLGGYLAAAQRDADIAEYVDGHPLEASKYFEVCSVIESIADDLKMGGAVRRLAGEAYNHNRAGAPGYALKGGQWVKPEQGIITQQ